MAEPALPLGVNLAGYLDATAGVGEAARNVAVALRAAGVAVAPLALSSRAAPRERGAAATAPQPLRSRAAPRERGAAATAPQPLHAVTIVCANPDGMPGARDELGAGAFDGPPRHRHVVVGGRRAAAALAARVRPRRRGLGRVALRRRRLRGRLAGARRAHADAGAARARALGRRPRRARPAARTASCSASSSTTRASPPQEPARARSRRSRAPSRPAGRREPSAGAPALVLKTLGGEAHPEEHRALLAAAAATPTSWCSTPRCPPPTRTRSSPSWTATCRCTARRGSG